MSTNYGEVTTNYGAVTINYGDVTTNYGEVTTNYGEVTTYYGDETTNYFQVIANYGATNCAIFSSLILMSLLLVRNILLYRIFPTSPLRFWFSRLCHAVV